MAKFEKLSRRERQILDVLYRLGQANAREVQDALPDAPGYSSIRTHLKKLVDKEFVGVREEGMKYLYYPVLDHDDASKSVLSNVVETFFGGEPALAVNQLLNMKLDEITDEELDDIEKLIKATRAEKKK
jgi:predicted transcriptional regulator